MSRGVPGEPVPRIEYLRVERYRALQDLELKSITPLTVFLGPNGSGKSTIFDVFAFLSECFSVGLRKAWDRRGRFRELRTRGENGPIVIELKYREKTHSPLITYHLAVDERSSGPYIAEEWLSWRRKPTGRPFRFLDFREGAGRVISGDMPDEVDERIDERLSSPEMIAVDTLGQFAKHPRVSALRRFITSWYLSYLSADTARGLAEAGPQERLSPNGDNLPNVIQYLNEQHSDRLEQILRILARRVPQLQYAKADLMPDGRLLLQIKDAPFEQPILARFVSDGTLKMLAYLTILYDPDPPQLIGIEEPENYLHPRLLPELAEECREAAGRTQLLVSSHSPFFVNGLRPEEVWVLYRDERGFTQARRALDMRGIPELVEEGAQLGHLWLEGHFEVGDPLTAAGGLRLSAAKLGMHLELFVEEPSAEAVLTVLLPRILGPAVSFRIFPHQGKPDLLRKLPPRLRAYRRWLPADWRVVVLVDADGADCQRIKADLEGVVTEAGLISRQASVDRFQVLTRIAIEELEAWYFGDVEALCAAYPGVPRSLGEQAPYRDPDAIRGGTWESLERVLQRAGYHRGGLEKIRAAREIGLRMDPVRNRSRSFQSFREGLLYLTGLAPIP